MLRRPAREPRAGGRAVVRLVGILNLTEDSFSDGGRFLDPEVAIAHGRSLALGGAEIVDVGAESSNPRGTEVDPAEQIRRLEPVVRALRGDGTKISIDSHRPEVVAAALSWGIDMVNDVTGLRDSRVVEILRGHDVPIVIMHARNATFRADEARAAGSALDDAIQFLQGRVADLDRAGIRAERLLVDPGMGFFLSADPEPSLEVLRGLRRVRRETGRPVYVSTSRKSFIGSVLGGRPVSERGAGSLATEIWAATHGADYIRTHDPTSLRDSLAVWGALDRTGSTE